MRTYSARNADSDPAMPTSSPSPAPRESGRKRFTAGALQLFHAYGNWLVGVTWMRFFLLSVLLLISAAILSKLPPFNLPIGGTEVVTITPGATPTTPTTPTPPKTGKREPIVKIEKQDLHGRDVTISIDKDGVRITPRTRTPSAVTSGASAASAAASDIAPAASASTGAAISIGDGGVEIKLPPGADS